ncbi:DUF1993 domain-containing protein [Sphingomonas antarctica]|uniref:DUF1993 domain-containing protein n=1 Tax=Sphingomonas antarctica TaxID=2040274 RepID=UPI0039ED0C33
MPSLYEITVPVFVRALRNLDHILSKGMESGVDEQTLIEARLAPDMLPLPKQIQIACDAAKLAVTRLAQTEPRPMADEEKTLPELRDRITKTIAYLEEADTAAFEGRETAEITMSFPNMEMKFTGQSLVTEFTLPNFFFHVTIAYALLRMNGVAIGKMDYLAGGQTVA